MRHSLELKTEQRLALTPQIRQSLRLLQMSSHSLDLEIKNRVENNPLLELEATDYYINQVTYPSDNSYDYRDTQFVNSKNQIDGSHYMMESEGFENFEGHLFKQVKLSHANTKQQLMIAFLIEFLDERGYLTESLEEINHLWNENDLPAIEATENWRLTLKFLQSFEPAGVGAQNLSECLILQLTARKENTVQKLLEPINLAIEICEQGLELLSKADYKKLQELTQASYAQIKEAQLLIQACDPAPAHSFSGDTAQTIVPDVILLKEKEHWQVKINPYIRTNLVINKDYLELIESNKGNQKFLVFEKKLQEAQLFIKQVQHRFSTILAVAQMIMQHQIDFLEQGDLGIKPLTLKMIAKKLNLHESTISRATKNKYIATPLGSYELSYFFSSQLASKAQQEVASARQVQALIKTWINNEAQDKPYSDSQLVSLLEQANIVLARRTVAKYRQQLGIAAKSTRKARYRLQAD